jgi:hypothetical protein
MKKLQTRETFEYLQKQGYRLTKEDWEHLNVEGYISIDNFDLKDINFINKNTKLIATTKTVRCGTN